MTIVLTALLFYAWERGPKKDHEPLVTTISEGGQAGWSYATFSLGMTLFAMIFLVQGCFFALFFHDRAKNTWSDRLRYFVVASTVFLAGLFSLALWMIGTFSWAYHGGIRCRDSASEANFDLNFLHHIGVYLGCSAFIPHTILMFATLVALHRHGMVFWPRRCQRLAAMASCGVVVSQVIFIREMITNKPHVSLWQSASQYSACFCMMVVQGSFMYAWRGWAFHLVLLESRVGHEGRD
eukprot:CAMPEP_0172719842 /NCGR_PEP_ID=MMETSP1074-20121228/75740_1 /TAXON_ID=2916 /ORGANISM="Ceratium fusus, Strain PA161109" /LENGTH=237 /DNA_ID=CAMNT_0013545241 /DNA_START=189 /DNA_END=902 /DNA_ORIENTATION=+